MEIEIKPLPAAAAAAAALRGLLVHHELVAEPSIFAGFWPFCESVKIFFACGGLKV